MIESGPLGMSVLRAIPPYLETAVQNGTMVAHGGAIRWPPGSERGGQIVRHLIVPHLQDPSRVLSSTAPILQALQATQALSALNLGVSAVGFSALFVMLDRIERNLAAIAKDVKAVRELLERREYAEFHAALERLAKISQVADADAKRDILVDAYRDFSVKLHQYSQRLDSAEDITVADASEQLLCLAIVALARCQAEMGSLDLAASDIRESIEEWRTSCRRIATELLLGEEPHRFLYGEFAESVRISDFVTWLDFTHEDTARFDWIDRLRPRLGQFYDSGLLRRPQLDDVRSVGRSLTGTALRRRIRKGSPAERLRSDLDVIVPFMGRITARNSVLEGYALQYELMAEAGVGPSALEDQLRLLPDEAVIDGFVLLEASDKSEVLVA